MRHPRDPPVSTLFRSSCTTCPKGRRDHRSRPGMHDDNSHRRRCTNRPAGGDGIYFASSLLTRHHASCPARSHREQQPRPHEYRGGGAHVVRRRSLRHGAWHRTVRRPCEILSAALPVTSASVIALLPAHQPRSLPRCDLDARGRAVGPTRVSRSTPALRSHRRSREDRSTGAPVLDTLQRPPGPSRK
jgi:hypothetical protein